MSNGSTEFYTKQGMSAEDAKLEARLHRKLARKKEVLYITTQFFISFTSSSYFQMAWNDVSFLNAFSSSDLMKILGMSLLVALTNTLITWNAFLSDPTAMNDPAAHGPLARAKPGEEPPKKVELPKSLNDPQ